MIYLISSFWIVWIRLFSCIQLSLCEIWFWSDFLFLLIKLIHSNANERDKDSGRDLYEYSGEWFGGWVYSCDLVWFPWVQGVCLEEVLNSGRFAISSVLSAQMRGEMW